jgi:hypothetical protein
MRYGTNILAHQSQPKLQQTDRSAHAPASNRLKNSFSLHQRCALDAGWQPGLIYRHRRRIHVSKHKNCMVLLCLHSEHRHEPDQSGHSHAALADVGRRNRQHYRDRAAARPYPTRNYPSAAAAGGTHWKSDLYPRGPPAVSDGGRRDGAELRAIDRRFSRRNAVAACFSGHRRSRRTRHPGSLCRLHAPLDSEDFPQSLSARSAGTELLALDTACRMRQARRSRYRAGDPHERFHRRTGGAAGAIDLDDRRAVYGA